MLQLFKSHKTTIHLTAILLAMLNITDIKIAGFAKILPLFDVMVVFYFTIFLQVFALWFVFLLGLFSDALSGNPLGLTSLVYILLIQLFVAANHKLVIKEDFWQILYQFLGFLFCFLFIKWLFLSIYNAVIYDATILIVQFILSGSFYVVMHKIFDFLSQKLSKENVSRYS